MHTIAYFNRVQGINMKTPFRFQASEYDCVPTTFLNAISFLFSRGEIPPIVIQKIYTYTLDTVSKINTLGHGTSGIAVEMLGKWLANFKGKSFSVNTEYLTGDKVHLKPRSKIIKSLKDGGVALLRVHTQNGYWHYVLAIKYDEDFLCCFDPYPLIKSNEIGHLEFIEQDGKQSHNLKIHIDWLDTKSNRKKYALGANGNRECLLLSRDTA